MFRLFAAALTALVLAVAPAAAQQTDLQKRVVTNDRAPDSFKVLLDTSKGPVTIQVTRAWAPNGADRFYNLAKDGYLDDIRFFRVVPGFMAQFGINADPNVSAPWRQATIKDDPVTQSNKRGYVTFATAGPDTRSTQVFINFKDNVNLDSQGFAPFGLVTSGMDVVDKLYAGYGDGAPYGRGPDQTLLQVQGNAYLDRLFPMLDYIKKATVQ